MSVPTQISVRGPSSACTRATARWLWPLAALLCLSTACDEPLDFERRTRDRGTFGEEVHTILLKDLVRSPLAGETRGHVFDEERSRFVSGVDATVTDDLLDPLDAVLIQLMPRYDDGQIPGFVRKLAIVLEEAMNNQPLMDALARLDARPDLLAQPERDRFLAHVLAFNRMAEMNTMLAELLLAHDGVSDTGGAESDATLQVLLALAVSLRDAEIDGDPDRFAVTLTDLLLTEDPAFLPDETFRILPAVKIDPRGLPKVRLSELGAIPFPFADLDGDGLADANAGGEFLTLDGGVHVGATPFGTEAPAGFVRDEEGRLLSMAGDGTVFEYVDLHRTALGYLLRDAADLADRDVPFDLLRAANAALGEPLAKSDADGAFEGYDPQGDVIGVARGLMFALDHDDVPAVLEGVSILLRDHPNDLAKVLRAMDRVSEISDAHPEGNLADDSNMLDELAPLLLEVVETPGLLEDLLLAMDHPAARETGASMALMMRRKKEKILVTPGGAYDACFSTCKATFPLGTVDRIQCIRACPNDEIFGPEVDRSAPESAANVSLFQRTQALMWEASGQTYEVGITHLVINGLDFSDTATSLGPVLVFDDLAESYLLSVTGDLDLGDMVNPQVMDLAGPLGVAPDTVVDVVLYINENVLGLTMGAQPTPDEVTRFFNLDPLESIEPQVEMTMEMAVCRSQRRCIDAHADTLFVVEASGLVDSLYPLAQAFTAHGKTELLARLFAAVYSHYPSRSATLTDAFGQPLPLVRSDIRSLEPMLIEILEDGAFLDALADQGPVMAGITLADDSAFLPALARHLTYVLTPDPTLTLISGDDFANDPQNQRVTPLSPLYLIVDPMRGLTDRLEADPVSEDAWDRATEALADIMLETEDDGLGGARFARPGGPVLARLALDEGRDRWLEEDAAGNRSTWLRDEVPQDLADAIADRGLASGVELFDWLDADPSRTALLREASLHTLEHGQPVTEQALIAVYGLLADGLDEPASVAKAHVLARAVDPRRTWDVEGFAATPFVIHGVQLLDETAKVDPENVVLELLSNGLEPSPEATTPLGDVWDIIRQLNRVEPGSSAPMSSADYQAVLGTVIEFMRDDQRGMERLYGFIETAIYGQAGKPALPAP